MQPIVQNTKTHNLHDMTEKADFYLINDLKMNSWDIWLFLVNINVLVFIWVQSELALLFLCKFFKSKKIARKTKHKRMVKGTRGGGDKEIEKADLW